MNAASEDRATEPVIDRHTFVPHYLAVLGNGLIWSQSRFYLDVYGIGINEVRLITIIAHSPNSTAKELCGALALNKSIVSRGLAELVAKGLVKEERLGTRRTYVLCSSGWELNRKIVGISFDRERKLLDGFSPSDKVILLGYLARMLQNLEKAVNMD